MPQQKEIPQPELGKLPADDLTWVYMLILHSKREAAVDMLVRPTENAEPFFSLKGEVVEGEQQLDINWPSLEKDAAILSELISIASATTKNNEPLSTHLPKITNLLQSSLLFRALDATSIVVTKEQKDENDQPITPWQHIKRVIENSYSDLPIPQQDKLAATLLEPLHDIGKMGAIHFLPQDANKDPNIRDELRTKYDKAGKHTQPKHSYVGALILEKLFAEINQNHPETALDEDTITLILNVVFHHHHFLYFGEEKSGLVEDWFLNEVSTNLLPTLPDNRPDLVVRFFTLLFNLRLADIKATAAHHKHWEGNMSWIREVPTLLRKNLPNTEEVKVEIRQLEEFINKLPPKL